MNDYVRTKAVFYHLCYRPYHTYGEEGGDFGRSRMLTDAEQEKYKKIFSDYLNDIDSKKFKYSDNK